MPLTVLFLCGEILLSCAAIFILRILRSFTGVFEPVEKVPEFQKVVDTKR